MADETLSYEDMYDLLRIEKASADLEKLEEKDLAKIARYFKAKEDVMAQQEVDTTFFGAKKRAKVQLEIENAMQILRDLFERREAKVINRAIFSIRSDSKLKDTTNMLEHEERLYNSLLVLLSENRESFFKVVEEQKKAIQRSLVEPALKPAPELAVPVAAKPNGIPPASGTPESALPGGEKLLKPAEQPETPLTGKETAGELGQALAGGGVLAAGAAEASGLPRTIQVKFEEDTPEFVDDRMNTCGPFRQGDIVTLPRVICDILLKQGKAKLAEAN